MAGGVQRIARIQENSRFPRWVRVSLKTVGDVGTEEVVMKLAEDEQELRVLFGDGNWTTWRRCL